MITYSNPRPYNAATGVALATAIQGYLQKVGVECTIDTLRLDHLQGEGQGRRLRHRLLRLDRRQRRPGQLPEPARRPGPEHEHRPVAGPDLHRQDQEAVSTMPNGAERDAAYGEMEKYAAERAIWLPLSHAKTLAGYRPKVSGFNYHVTGNVFLSNVVVKRSSTRCAANSCDVQPGTAAPAIPGCTVHMLLREGLAACSSTCIKRVLMVIPVMIGVSIIVFSLMRVFSPDPAPIVLGQHATQESMDAWREANGLNEPVVRPVLQVHRGRPQGRPGYLVLHEDPGDQGDRRALPGDDRARRGGDHLRVDRSASCWACSLR